MEFIDVPFKDLYQLQKVDSNKEIVLLVKQQKDGIKNYFDKLPRTIIYMLLMVSFAKRLGYHNNYLYNDNLEFCFCSDYTTHKGNPSLLLSDSVLKYIGRSNLPTFINRYA